MLELQEISNSQFRFCCEIIWGGVPNKVIKPKPERLISKEELIASTLFQEKAPEILKKYPYLDKSI